MVKQVTRCPVCEGVLHVSELSCVACATSLRGRFPLSPLARLTPEQQSFIETFVRCRGVIRDVERALGISYPTVRARLDTVVEALGQAMGEAYEIPVPAPPLPPMETAEREVLRRDILRQVEEGTMSPGQAAGLLRHL